MFANLPIELKEIIFRRVYELCLSDVVFHAHYLMYKQSLTIVLNELITITNHRKNFMYDYDIDITIECISCYKNIVYDDCIKCDICCNPICVFCTNECPNMYCHSTFCMHCIDHGECYECDQREIYDMNKNRYRGDSGTDSDDYNDSNIIESDESDETDETDETDEDL